MKILVRLKKYTFWLLLSLLMGGIGGVCGAAFAKAVSLVTALRTQNNFILYLLPLGGLLVVAAFMLFRVKGCGTKNVFEAAKNDSPLPHGLSLSIFIGSVLSHLFGASVGREGAALQIGGGVASVLSHWFKLNKSTRRVLILCGMASLFSALFGTPFAAAAFVIEIIMTGLCLKAALPILISSLTAFKVAMLLHTHPERFNVGTMPKISLSVAAKILIIVIACVLVSFLWCSGLRLCCKYAKKLLKNEFLRIAIGGIIIVLLTLLVGSRDYNGGGVDIISRIFDDQSVRYEAFALKLLFTLICVSAGYKGGEIVPTLFIGATLGGALALILELPIGISAAVGIAVLFASATKCPVATILLCCEMFGLSYAAIIAVVVIIGTVLSHWYSGLYDNSIPYLTFITSKTKPR